MDETASHDQVALKIGCLDIPLSTFYYYTLAFQAKGVLSLPASVGL